MSWIKFTLTLKHTDKVQQHTATLSQEPSETAPFPSISVFQVQTFLTAQFS